MTSRISLNIEAPGDLYVNSVVLANAAPGSSTVGVKRNSDSVEVIAEETIMNNDVTDTTLWYYDTAVLDPLTDYTAYIRVEFYDEDTSAFDHYEYVTAHIAGISSHNTFRRLRRMLLDFLGGWGKLVNESVIGADGIKSSKLVDTDAKTSAFNHTWWYVTSGVNAGLQARTKQDGFTPDQGEIRFNRNLTGSTEVGVEVEYSSRLPIVSEGKFVGLREILNQALQHLWTVDAIDIPDADGINTQINSFDWLRRQSQIIDVQFGGNSSDYPYSLSDHFMFRYDADNPLIIGPSGTNVDKIVAYRPLNTWMKRGGAWQEADGFVDDSDECLGDPILIVQVALYFAYRALASAPYEGESAKARWEALAQRQATIAANIKRMHSPEGTSLNGNRFVWDPRFKELVPVRSI